MPQIDPGALGLLRGSLVCEPSYNERLPLNYGLLNDVLGGL
ncbi:MAG: hypothetical protein RLY75_433 [Pseudomonadota bacterium]